MHTDIATALVTGTMGAALVYSILLVIAIVLMCIFSALEARDRGRTAAGERGATLAQSRFALPVSIVASAYNEETMILPSVRSLLAQRYAEFEVIVVNDGSTDRTFELLQQAYELYPDTTVHPDLLPHRALGSVHISAIERRLIVVSKENGANKADAMNCGVNFARYPYICSVDGDTMYHDDALLSAMGPVNHAPHEVIGVTSFFGNSRAPEMVEGAIGQRTVERHLLSVFQHLDLMRSFVASRLAWSRFNCMMCNPGGFAVWRREDFMEVGGFSNAFSCEDLELTFRMHERARRKGSRYRIVSLPGMVARTEGPERPASLVRQRARWQKVVLEVVWHYRRMLLRPRYGLVGSLALPYFILFEALAPLLQLFSLVSLTAAVALDLMDWPLYAGMLGATALLNASAAAFAVRLNDRGYRDYRVADLIYMLAIGPLDMLYFRPIIMWSGMRGTWQFLKRDRGWDKFERNARPGPGAPAAAVATADPAPTQA